LKKEVQKEEEMEQWFKSLLNGLEIVIDDDRPDSIYYKKNGRIFFELFQIPEKRYFWCDYDLVWSVLKNKYNLDYDETQEFITRMVEQHLKLAALTPICAESIAQNPVEQP
jgi:hypothetical protein